MTVNRVSFLQNLGTVYTAEELRRVLKLIANRQPGVNAAGDLAVSQNGSPNMSVNTAAGEALVNGSETTTQGTYYNYNDAVLNRTIATADATNPRNDLAVLRDRDQFYSGTFNDGDVVIVTGTPAPSPVDPTPPVDSLTLARVRVAAGATSITNANITDLRQWQAQKLVPGTAGWTLRDSGDANTNIGVTDAGLVTLRNALLIPPSAGGTLAATGYGTVPVKIAEIIASGNPTSLTFSGIPQTYRSLLVTGRLKTTTTTATVYVIGVSLLGDVGNFYSATSLTVNGKGTNTTLVGSQAANQANVFNALLGATSASDATGGLSASFAAYLPNYRDTTPTKHWLAMEVLGDSSGPNIYLFGGAMGQTTAITTLTFGVSDGFTNQTIIELYGLP